MRQDQASAAPPIEGPGARRIPYLDGWRGLSIALVLIGHFFDKPLYSLANLGVEMRDFREPQGSLYSRYAPQQH